MNENDNGNAPDGKEPDHTTAGALTDAPPVLSTPLAIRLDGTIGPPHPKDTAGMALVAEIELRAATTGPPAFRTATDRLRYLAHVFSLAADEASWPAVHPDVAKAIDALARRVWFAARGEPDGPKEPRREFADAVKWVAETLKREGDTLTNRANLFQGAIARMAADFPEHELGLRANELAFFEAVDGFTHGMKWGDGTKLDLLATLINDALGESITANTLKAYLRRNPTG